MNIQKAIETIMLSYEIKRPLLMMSSPGVGKSSGVYQAASKMSGMYNELFGVIEVRAATSNPAELADIKAVIDGKIVDLAQDWVPTKEKVARGECPKRGLIFLDEIADGTATTQSALQQLLLDRRLGSAYLADGWATVAASNRQTDKAAAGRLSTALINRCMTVTIDPDTDAFVAWGLENGLSSDVIAFCRWRTSPWNFDPTAKTKNPAFCSPRSMHILSDILKVVPEPDFEIVTGTIGDGVGSEFSGFLQLKAELPDLNNIIKNPDTCKVPTRTDIAIAVMYALMARIDEDNLMNIVTYFARNIVELATCAFKDLAKQKPEICSSKVLQDWMCKPENIKLFTMGFE